MMGTKIRYPLTVTRKLDFETIPAWIRAIAARLAEHGYQAYLVGGAVRDLLSGCSPQDWDLASDALPEEVEAIFGKTIPTGKKFGTITVVTGGQTVEITTLREDLDYSDGRRPQNIRFTKEILLDLSRRDFTINAIAYDLTNNLMIDPFQGGRDLRQRILKAVGVPAERFAEDGLRMFRFFRFLATRDLRPDRATFKAINPAWSLPVSRERIGAELNHLILGKNVDQGLTGLKISGLLESVIPELGNEPLELGDTRDKKLWEHLRLTVAAIQPRPQLRWAALLHDVAKPDSKTADCRGVHFYGHDTQGSEIARRILERFHFPNALINPVAHLIRWHMFSLPAGADEPALRRFIAKVGPETVPDLLELRRADIVASGRITYETWEYWQYLTGRVMAVLNSPAVYRENRLAVNGDDLIAGLGLTPGPAIGTILRHLLEQVLERPELNEKEELMRIAAEFLEESGREEL
jgi:tRNA nucleotidyltransferase (CCA-adding enzyme)